MSLIVLGSKQKQDQSFQTFLKQFQEKEIHYVDLQKNMDSQLKNIQTTCEKKQLQINLDLLYFLKKSQQSENQTLIRQLNQSVVYSYNLILITDDKNQEEAEKIKCQTIDKLKQISIMNWIQYQQTLGSQIQVINPYANKSAIFISNSEIETQNRIFQTLNQSICFPNQWSFINTPQFNINCEDSDMKEKIIQNFQQILFKHSAQIQLIFFILQYERIDVIKQTFMELFGKFKKFQNQIIVLLYNFQQDPLQEVDKELNDHFYRRAKIKQVYILNSATLINKNQLEDFFKNILQGENDGTKGIDLKGTIFEIEDREQQQELKQEIEKIAVNIHQQHYEARCQQLQIESDKIKTTIIDYEEKIKLYKQLLFELKFKQRDVQQELTKASRSLNEFNKQQQTQVGYKGKSNQYSDSKMNLKYQIETENQSLNLQLQNNLNRTYCNVSNSEKQDLESQRNGLIEQIIQNNEKLCEFREFNQNSYNNQFQQTENYTQSNEKNIATHSNVQTGSFINYNQRKQF